MQKYKTGSLIVFLKNIRKRYWLIFACIVFLLLVFVVKFFYKEQKEQVYTVYLPNYYEIRETAPDIFEIMKKENNTFSGQYEHVIGPNITSYAIIGAESGGNGLGVPEQGDHQCVWNSIGEVVVGEIGTMPKGQEAVGDAKGFFIIQTNRGTVWKGLDEKEFMEKLKAECGINEMPLLLPPNIFNEH